MDIIMIIILFCIMYGWYVWDKNNNKPTIGLGTKHYDNKFNAKRLPLEDYETELNKTFDYSGVKIIPLVDENTAGNESKNEKVDEKPTGIEFEEE